MLVPGLLGVWLNLHNPIDGTKHAMDGIKHAMDEIKHPMDGMKHPMINPMDGIKHPMMKPMMIPILVPIEEVVRENY